MKKDATKKQWQLFGAASIVLLLGIISCVATANVISDKLVWLIGGSFAGLDIALWIGFFKVTGWFSNRHEDGGSSVK